MRVKRGVDVSASPDSSRSDVAGLEPASPGDEAGIVEVRVAAEPTQLSVLRAVVGDLAMRADFDVDSIADLRLAVDEACSSLIRLAAPSAELICRFNSDAGALSVSAEVQSTEPTPPRTDTFSWRVLGALTDSVAASIDSHTPDGIHVVRIDLSKQRVAHG
jgi:serine/threonine-protein kinase RsbW